MKRGVSVIFVLMVLLNSIFVAGETTVTLAPAQAYETNHVSFELNISNFRGSYEVKMVQASPAGFSILALVDYKGWSESFAGSIAEWKEGSIATNVILSSFEFLGKADLVDADTHKEVLVTMTDPDSQTHTYTFPFDILNDNTAPSLQDTHPVDGGFVKEGDSEYLVSVNATDPETGIQNVTFHYVRCNYDENITPQDHTLQLAQSNGLYGREIDLSSYDNEQQVCFDFSAYNNGGEESEYSGTITIDGVPPSVTLVSPVDGAIIGLAKNFSFFAADNLAPEMTCDMDIDGTEYMEDIAAPHMDVVFIPSADVAEGQHEWKMRCTDAAGLEGSSGTWGYTLDKTPPSIQLKNAENDTIIASTTALQVEVTDNYQLHKVWLVIDGNKTEVESIFGIDVSEWPEGPSEFTVMAEDSVRNKAEQTYRIIVDRTPPTVELVAPEDAATSDVHVSFRYMVQDNYDNEMDCNVYIDDIGQEQQLSQGNSETEWQKIVALGAHRWKVQCVDDAGNAGTSDERTISVVDLTGPDIQMENPDTFARGDTLQLSLDVTDISGVETVNAELVAPDDTTQPISLEKLGDTYTASVETTPNTATGTYTLKVQAVDTLNNSNEAQDQIEVTYKYIVALDLNPTSATPGAAVTASGLVIYDNGSLVPEESISLLLPGNVTTDVAIADDGKYTHAFNAPAEQGAYSILASVTSLANGKTYSSTEALAVATQQSGVQGGHGGHGGTSSTTTSAGSCTADWSCTAWTTCSDGKQARTCVDINDCSSDAKKTDTRSCTEKTEKTEETQDDTATGTDTVSAARQPLPESEEQQAVTSGEDEGHAAGIGKASGFMSALSINWSTLIIAMLLMALVMGTLYKYGWSKGDKRKRPAAIDFLGSRSSDGMGLESYLKDRANRRDRF